MKAYFLCAIFLTVQFSANSLRIIEDETDDTVIIDASDSLPLPLEIQFRHKRQFPFQFPNWPKFPALQPRPPTRPSCYSSLGDMGECVTLKQCFPILYSVEDEEGNSVQNPGLAAMLRNASGPCESPVMGNYLFFKADAEVRQHFVCCSQNKRPAGFPTLRPTGAPPTPPAGIKLTTRWSTIPPTPPAGIKLTTRWSTIPPTPPVGIKLTTRWSTIGLPKPPTAPPKLPTTSEATKVDTSSSCGMPRIVGGTVSVKGKHPWIVALTSNGRQFCGGSLISKNFILTAAHCVSHMRAADISRIRVHLGEHTLGIGENTEQFEKVTRVLYHRGFSHQTLHNDIALLKLESPARESAYIQPVCLSQDTRNLQNSIVTLAGWGQVQDGGQQSTTLKEVSMEVWSLESCAAKYGHKAPAGIISSMMCAGSPGKDACRGDSGGPLTMKNSRHAYEQVGVVSWGIGCGSYPGVYTKVTAFLPWIEKNRKL